jgi:alanyl-tRNA synthetase
MKTHRLYYSDATLLAFDAIAIAHVGDPQHVVLDQTAFYPTSGGQPHDTGMLNAVRVVDVIDDGDGIVHVLEAPLQLGPVRGTVDWSRRHDLMQQHSWETVSVHFGADHSSIEFDTAAVSDTALRELEVAANAEVAAARPVTVSFEAPAEAIARGLRKAPADHETVRVITIAGLDRSACGGTHVSSTAAIGAIVVHGVEKIRGHARVGFLAGDRVIGRVHGREELLGRLAGLLSCAIDELPGIVEKRQVELKDQRVQIEQLEQEVALARLRALIDEATADAQGVRRLAYRSAHDSPSLLRAMVQGVATLDRTLLVATSCQPPMVFFGSGPGTGVDAGASLKAALGAVGGRGGGSPTAAQGTVASSESLGEVVALLVGPSQNETPSQPG